MEQKPESLSLLLAWIQANWPAIYGCGLGGIIAALRVIYDGGTLRQMMLEGMLCGALTLAVASALEWLSLPASVAPFFGGFIGLIGVEGVRRFATRYVESRAGRK